jgi:hypothetical protein
MSIDILNSQIASMTAEIAALNTLKTTIQADPSTGTELTAMVTAQLASIDAQITAYTNMQTQFQNSLNVLTTGWTTDQQTYVTDINTLFPDQYTQQLTTLMMDSSDDQAAFFTPYSQATTTFMKQNIINCYFNL